MIFELQFDTHIGLFFGLYQSMFLYMVIVKWYFYINSFFLFVDIVTWYFYFCRGVQKIQPFCFSHSFVQKTIQQPVGRCNVTSDAQLSSNFFKNRYFVSANTYKKHSIWGLMFYPPHWQDVLPLKMQKSRYTKKKTIKSCYKTWTHCFNYQIVDCLCTSLKYE